MARRTLPTMAAVGVLVLALAAVLGATRLDHEGAGGGASGTRPGVSESPSVSTSTSPRGGKSRTGSEQPTAAGTPTSKALPGLRPARRTPVRPVGRPASARGRLVRTFPSAAVPLPTGARVRFSSVSSSEGRVQADVVADSPLSADQVFAFYRSRLRSHGLLGAPVEAAAGSVARTYSDGRTSVTVTRAGTGTVSVDAVLCCVAASVSQ